MPLLYFWRSDNYRRDLDMGAGYHLNQANSLLHDVEKGDSLWAFTRNRQGDYVLAAELIVHAKTLNSPGFRYGPYRLWGDLSTSRYFQIEGQPSIEGVIRQLSCETNATILGRSFQGLAAVRKINIQDHQFLSVAARGLTHEPRARLLPEDRLEASLLYGYEDAVADLLSEVEAQVSEERQKYLYSQCPKRNPKLVRELQNIYGGKYQICEWSPQKEYGYYICHGHHIHWLSRGGEDSLENLMLVCPNHHAAIHRCDAPFDFGDSCFDFGTRRESLNLNVHLPT